MDEVERIKYKTTTTNKLAAVSYLAQTKDPGDLEKVGPEEVGPHDTKLGQGKRPADRLDNKQPFGEGESHQAKTTMKHVDKPNPAEKKAAKDIKPGIKGYKDRIAMLKATKARGALKEDEITETDLTPQQTKMAHTIGKEFEKKNVGDKSKGGPYAVATAMVKNKPEAAQKAYATIKAKMKEDADVELLNNLYDSLNEENQQTFMNQLEEDADVLLAFAKTITEE